MFTQRLADLPERFGDFRPGPSPRDRHAWQSLPEEVRAALLAGGEAVRDTDYPSLPATLWLDYHRTGQRVPFETRYFDRRRQLNALVMAECVEGRGRYIDRIVEGVMLLCEESGWQLPAHNSHERNGERHALADPERPVIDLFAAETGAQLAAVAALLGAQLEAAAPGLVARIDRELERRIAMPYLTRHFWWMGDGDERMNNWTAWCTQNVLLAVFSRPTAQPVRQAVVRQAAASLDAFLKDYGEDGACEEGVLYYRHAGLCLFNAMAILDAVAPGVFSPLWGTPKIRNIAEYIVTVHAAGRWSFNFADCPPTVEPCGPREYLFGKAVGSARLMDFAAADWQRERRANLPDEINLFYRVQAAFAARQMAEHQPAMVRPADAYLSSVGLFIARDARFALAAKAGDNGDSHNHNDVGSVILYKDGRPVLIDVGVESYTAKTFSPDRYTIWTMQSAFHNLPSFGGVMQRDGEAYAAREVETRFGDAEASIAMEIADAYPPEARLRSYHRTVRLMKARAVEITDVFDGDRRPELSLMLAIEPRLDAGRIVLPGLAEIMIEGSGEMRLETIPINDPRLRQSWPERLYRVLVPLAGRELHIVIA